MFGKLLNKLMGGSESEKETEPVRETRQEKQSFPPREYYEIESFDNAIEYNNVIMKIMDQLEVNLDQFNYARDIGDHDLTEEARLVWLKDLKYYKKQLNSLEAYCNIDILREEALKYVSKIEKVLEDGYKKRIELLKAGKEGSSEEVALRDENNRIFRKISDKFNEASDEFLTYFDENGNYTGFNSEEITDEFKHLINPEISPDDPMLEPIHGISLYDYAAGTSHLGNGVAEELILSALGVEKPLWDEASQLWIKRMQMDPDFRITTLYGKYFAEVQDHPTLGKLNSTTQSSTGANSDNVSRIMNDEKFYYELAGARMAAYDAGIDGAQWILENYAIPLGDFQTAASKWMQNMTNVAAMMQYQEKMQNEYAKKFAESQGGNVADDIEF